MQEHILLKSQFEKFAESVYKIYKQAKKWNSRNNISESIVVFELAKHIAQYWNNLSVILEEPYPDSKPDSKRNIRCDIVVCEAGKENEWKFALEAKYLFVRGAGTVAQSDVRKSLINDIERLAQLDEKKKCYLLWVFETPNESAHGRKKYKPGENFIARYDDDFKKLLDDNLEEAKIKNYDIKRLFVEHKETDKIVLPYDKGDDLKFKKGSLYFYLLYLLKKN